MIAGITASTRRFQGGGFVIKTTNGVVTAIEGPGEVPGTGVYVYEDGEISGGQLEEVLSWPEEKPDWLGKNGVSFHSAYHLIKVPDTLPAWITDMSGMFTDCSSFNQDISGWDTSNVTNMSYMFTGCGSFNGDISGWDTSNVTGMRNMFYWCSIFNQDLSGWDTGNVTDMNFMFYDCTNFNQDISGWDTSNVTDMSGMFIDCSSFNQDISGWDTSNVTNMPHMFIGCGSFNGDISGWDTSNVTDMTSMFSGCTTFNQDISGWVTSNVTDMDFMFYDCTNFNQDLSGWCVPQFTEEPYQFSFRAESWTLPKPVWGTCPQQTPSGDFSLIVGDAGEDGLGYVSEINTLSRPPTGTLLNAPLGIAGELVTRWESFYNKEGSLSIWARIYRDRPYAETKDVLVTFHLPEGDVVREFTLHLYSLQAIRLYSNEIVPDWIVGQTVHFSIEIL